MKAELTKPEPEYVLSEAVAKAAYTTWKRETITGAVWTRWDGLSLAYRTLWRKTLDAVARQIVTELVEREAKTNRNGFSNLGCIPENVIKALCRGLPELTAPREEGT